MPFGLPPSQDAAYGSLVTGVQANSADLSALGLRLKQLLGEAVQLNVGDLAVVMGKITTALNKGAKVNASDMGIIAQSLAQILASGAQANSADLTTLMQLFVGLPKIDNSPYYTNQPALPPDQQAALEQLQVLAGVGPPNVFSADPSQAPIDPSGAPADTYGVWTVSGDKATRTFEPNLPASTSGQIPASAPLPDSAPAGFSFAPVPPGGGQVPPAIPPGQVQPAASVAPLLLPNGKTYDPSKGKLYLTSPLGLSQLLADKEYTGPIPTGDGVWKQFNSAVSLPQPVGNDQYKLVPIDWTPSVPAANFDSVGAWPGGISPSAQLIVQMQTGPVPLPTPPPPPPPPGDSAFQSACKIADLPPIPQAGDYDIGAFGSPAMCQGLQNLASEVSAIGDSVYAWLDSALDGDALLGDVTFYEVGGIVTPYIAAMQLLHNIVNMLKCLAKSVLKLLRDMLRWVRAFMIKVNCNPAALTGIYVLLALVRGLEKVRMGSDAGVWATLDAHIEFPALVKMLEHLSNYSCPMELPAIPEALEAYLRNTISLEVCKCWVAMAGGAWEVWEPVLMARAERLSPDELIRQGHRQQWTDQQIDQRLKERGWHIDSERQWRQDLFWELPTIGDHLHWLARNADDTEYVQQFGLLDGFSTQAFINSIPEFANYENVTDPGERDFWGRYGPDLSAQGMRAVNAAYHYIAHWVQPSPEQMKEFVYRLRPGAPGMTVTFTPDDYSKILAEQDYSPTAREWFAETIYRIPAPTYIIGMYRQNVITDADLKAYHQDLGYTAVDSDRFVGVDKIQKTQMRASTYRGWTPMAIGNAFVTGRIDDLEVRNRVLALGGTVQEADDLMNVAQANIDKQVWQRARSKWLTAVTSKVCKSVDAGAMTPEEGKAALVALGWPEERAQGVVEAYQATGRLTVIKQTVASVKRSYHDGYINTNGAGQLLTAAGITPAKINEYLSLWGIQNTPRRKRRTAKEIVNDLANGMMDTPEALMRLWNLGYDQADSMLYIADAQRQLIGRSAKAASAAHRDARTQAQALAKLQRQAQQQARRLRSELQRIAPRSVLQKWLAKGTITLPVFRVRMAALGYPPGTVEAYAADAPTDPKIGQLMKWLTAGEITDGEFESKALELGYDNADIIRFRTDAKAKASQAQAPS